jgi:hypothetical protein
VFSHWFIFKKPCPIYIILVYTTFPPYFIMPCDVQLYLPQIIPSCAYFPYHTSSYHHTGPGILYVFEGTSKPVLFCIYKSLLTHIPFMDACFAKFNREIQRKSYDCGSGSMQRVYSGTRRGGGGQGIPKKTPKTNRMVMQESRSFSNLFQSWKIVILDSFNFMFLSWNPGVSTL